MKKQIFALVFSALSLVLVLPLTAPQPAAAEEVFFCHGPEDSNGLERCMIAEGGKGSCPTTPGWTENNESCKCGANSEDECVQLENPLESGTTDIPTLIGVIIRAFIGIVGAVSLLMFFWGAKSWVMAAGNSEKVAEGTKTMVWAALGLVITLGSYTLLDSIIKFITGQIGR